MLASVVQNNTRRGRNFCLQKSLTGLAGLVYLFYQIGRSSADSLAKAGRVNRAFSGTQCKSYWL